MGHRTASMIAASAKAGALLAGAPADRTKARCHVEASRSEPSPSEDGPWGGMPGAAAEYVLSLSGQV